MERQPASAVDEQIIKMARALRVEEMPAAPAALLSGMPVRLRGGNRGVLLATGACMAALAIGAMLLIPRESAAAVLDRIAQAGDDAMRHELFYDKQPDGSWVVTQEVYVGGNRFHAINHQNAENVDQYIVGDRKYDYFPRGGYAIVETYRPKREGVFFRSSLKRQLSFNGTKSVSRAGTVDWKGKRLDRFNVHSEIRDALGQMLNMDGYILADTSTDRPYYEEYTISGDQRGQFVGGHTAAIEWQYPIGQEGELAVNLPAGTHVFEPEKLREQVKEQVTGSLQTARVGETRVTLRAVYADEGGYLHVFTSGGAGPIEGASEGLKVNGGAPLETFSGGQNHGHGSGGKYVYEPLRYRGVDLLYHGAGRSKIPDTFDLEVPVWRTDGSSVGRTFAGYAKFKDVVPVRIAGQVLSVMNRSILWSEKDFAIEDARWKKSATASSR